MVKYHNIDDYEDWVNDLKITLEDYETELYNDMEVAETLKKRDYMKIKEKIRELEEVIKQW